VFAQARGRDFPRLGVVFADREYHNHTLYRWLRGHRRPYRLETSSRPPGERRFVPLPARWVVERAFAWLGRYRRPGRDHVPGVVQSLHGCSRRGSRTGGEVPPRRPVTSAERRSRAARW
jgi:hypothetical protein